MLFSGLWNNTASNNLVEATAQKMIEEVNGIAKGMGLLREFQYMNYADPSQDPIASYGGDNVNFLKRVSKKYDSRGVFQTKVPGGFKVFGKR